MKNLDSLHLDLIIIHWIDEIRQSLLNFQLILGSRNHIFVNPFRQIYRSKVGILFFVLLPKLLVNHLDSFLQTYHTHTLWININLHLGMQNLKNRKLPQLHNLTERFFAGNANSLHLFPLIFCFHLITTMGSKHRLLLLRSSRWHWWHFELIRVHFELSNKLVILFGEL